MAEMIWINVWNRVLCRFVRTLVSRSVAKAMPHIIVTSTALLTCGPSTHTGLPPIPNMPLIPAINIPSQPVQPTGPQGPQWTYGPQPDYQLSPPEGGWLAPGDFTEEQPGGIIADSGFRSYSTGVPFDTDSTPAGNVSTSNAPPTIKQTQPTPTVGEPAALGWFLGACAFLVILRRSEG